MSQFFSAGLFDAIPDSGISRWTFDDADTESGEAVDVWGSNNLTINGATTGQTGIAGYDSGEAYNFDGTDDRTYYDYSTSEISQYTFTIWINSNSDDGKKFAVDDDNGNTNSTSGFEVRHNNGSIEVFKTSSGGFGGWVSGGSLSTGTDAFIGVAVDASINEATVDINGSRTTISPNTLFNLFRFNRFAIGRGQSGFKNYFDGLIDDPRLYDKRLSASELDNLRISGSING